MEDRAWQTQVQTHLQPERVPSLGDDPREPGQASGIHFNPLMEVVPASTPSPIIEVVFVNACLERREGSSERSWVEDDEDRSFLGTEEEERIGEGHEGEKEEKALHHQLRILNHGRSCQVLTNWEYLSTACLPLGQCERLNLMSSSYSLSIQHTKPHLLGIHHGGGQH